VAPFIPNKGSHKEPIKEPNTMSHRLSDISSFVEVVNAGSFALAAARLEVTRSAVGKTIARLELHLGVRLFHRTTRRQNLTDDGHAYYERCVRALAELDAAAAAFDNGRREPSGRLRVSAPVLFGRHCVAPVLTRLASRHPGLELEIAFSDHVVNLPDEGFDLAVRVGPLRDSSQLVARRLGVQRMAICAAPDYLARHGTPQSAADFSGHAGIVYGRSGFEPLWQLRPQDGQVEASRIASRLRFDDLQAIADAAVAGLGLAWLPCWLLGKYLKTGELRMVMDGERMLPSDIHAVWPQAKHLPSRTRAAIDALVAEIPQMIGYAGPCPAPAPLPDGAGATAAARAAGDRQ
jgi:DNA-binding transcriptional LysR family regulator